MGTARVFATLAVLGLTFGSVPAANSAPAGNPLPPTAVGYTMPEALLTPGWDEASAPPLPTGTLTQPARLHVETLSAGEEIEPGRNLFRVQIPQGHRLHIGGIAVPELRTGTPQYEGYSFAPSLRRAGEGGLRCRTVGSIDSTNMLSTAQPSVISLSSSLFQGAESECYDADLLLDLGMQRRRFDKPINIDLSVALVAEPADKGDSFNEKPSEKRTDDAVGEPLRAGKPQPIRAGAQPDAAPELIGTAEGEIVEGETQFYAVPVQPGQSIRGTIEVLEPAGGEGGDAFLRTLKVWAINPLGQSHQLVGETSAQVSAQARRHTFASEYAVSYANLGGARVTQTTSWLGGRHYVAVSFTSFAGRGVDEPAESAPVNYRLILEPIGKPVAGPDFGDAPTGPAENPDRAALPETADTQATPDNLWRWVLLGAGGVAILSLLAGLVVHTLQKR